MALQKFYPLDVLHQHRDISSAALTASAYVGSQIDQIGAVLTEFITIINVEAIDIASGDETYTFSILGSNDPARSDATVLGTVTLGKASAIANETVDTAAGDRHTIQWQSAKNGTNYRYFDLRLDVAGTTPSITFNAYTAGED